MKVSPKTNGFKASDLQVRLEKKAARVAPGGLVSNIKQRSGSGSAASCFLEGIEDHVNSLSADIGHVLVIDRL